MKASVGIPSGLVRRGREYVASENADGFGVTFTRLNQAGQGG